MRFVCFLSLSLWMGTAGGALADVAYEDVKEEKARSYSSVPNAKPSARAGAPTANEAPPQEAEHVYATEPKDEKRAVASVSAPGSATPSVAPSTGSGPRQPSRAFPNHRSPQRDQLFVYQGDYRKLGATVEEVALTLKPYDVILLTHAFSVINEKDPLLSSPSHQSSFADALKTTNGTCSDSKYEDDNGKGVADLMKLLRAQNPQVKLYGYIPATADLHVRHNKLAKDNLNVEGYATCWSSAAAHLAYDCPGGVCTDFVRWVGRWRALESVGDGIWLDGFFLDMVNAVHVSASTWANQTSYLSSLRNGFQSRYLVMANTLETEASSYHADPVGFAANGLVAGDSVMVEGFYLKAGALNPHFASLQARLARLHREKGLEWVAIANETGYKCDGTDPGYVSGGTSVAAQEAGSSCQAWLISPATCGMDNFKTGYGLFKGMRAQGARAFLYSESNLGVYSGVSAFCPHQ